MFNGNVTWDSENDGMTGGSLTVSTTYGLIFESNILYLGGSDRHNFSSFGRTLGTGEWTWGVPTDYAVMVLNFERDTPLQDAFLSLGAGVSNVLTGEQRMFGARSAVTSVQVVPEGADTLSLLGLGLLSLVAIRRLTLVTP